MASDSLPDPSTEEILRRLSRHAPREPRYKLEGEVAKGGMGEILKVWDEDLRRHLAMKVVLSGEGARDAPGSINQRQLARFLEEAQVTGQLDHPGIVPVHELGLDQNGRAFFTMKLVKGRDLRAIYDLVFAGDADWSETRALSVLLKVCEGVAYAHKKGVIHRDLKPANVMVGDYGEVYVMDWGLARVIGRADRHDVRIAPDAGSSRSVRTERRAEREETPDSPIVTMDGDVVGTPSYMPPEQARGEVEKLSARSDVYAVGAMLYHLLTGQMPFVTPGVRVSNRTVLARVLDGPPAPLTTLRRDTPAELVAICEKAMARDAERRYADTLELADDLRAYLERRVVRAHASGAWAETRMWVRRNKPLAAALASVILCLIVASIICLQFARSEREQRTAAEERQRELRSASYAKFIRAADASLIANDRPMAIHYLDAAPADQRHWEWRYLDSLLDRSILVLSGHERSVRACAYSPDASRILTGGADPVARVWDSSTGRMIHELRGHDGGVAACAFEVGGKKVLTLDDGGNIRTWDVSTGAQLSQDKIEASDNLSAATFSADATRVLAALGYAASSEVFETATGKLLQTITPFRVSPHTLVDCALNSDGSRIVAAYLGGAPWIGETSAAELKLQLEKGGTDTQLCAFSPDDRNVLTIASEGTLHLWDATTRELLRSFPRQGSASSSCTFSPDGSHLLIGAFDGACRLLDSRTGQQRAVLRAHADSIAACDFSPDGSRFVTASSDGTARVWETDTAPQPQMLPLRVLALAPSPDGSRLFCISDSSVIVWDMELGASIVEMPAHVEAAVAFAAYSADGSRMLMATKGAITLWDAVTGDELISVDTDMNRPVLACAFGHDGPRVLSTTDSSEVVVRKEAEGLVVIGVPSDPRITASTFSPDGTRLLTITGNLVGELRDATTGALLQSFQLGGGRVLCCALSPDGTRLLTFSEDHKVRICDVNSGRVVQTLVGHGRPKDMSPFGVASFGPDGSRVITASVDSTARIWSTASGDELMSLRLSLPDLFSCGFSPDGERVFVCGLELETWDSVPWKLRSQRRRELEAAQAEARERLEVALAQTESRRAAGELLSGDMSLDSAVRHVALNMLMQCAEGERAAAHAALERAMEGEPSEDLARQRLLTDPALDAPSLERALELLQHELCALDAIESSGTLNPTREQLREHLRANTTLTAECRTRALKHVRPAKPWSASAATGPPDAAMGKDDPRAWAHAQQDSGVEWLEVSFRTASRCDLIRIWEVIASGAVIEILAFEPGGTEHRLWSGVDPTSAPGVFEIQVPLTPYPVARLRLLLDTNLDKGWSEIDAVQISGPGGAQYAWKARASSEYGE